MCPNCDYTWSDDMTTLMVNLKKVKFKVFLQNFQNNLKELLEEIFKN